MPLFMPHSLSYPGFCQINEMENNTNLPIWTGPFRKKPIVFFTALYDVDPPTHLPPTLDICR